MSDSQTFVLRDADIRNRAVAALRMAPVGYAVTIREPTRSLEANAALHALIADIVKSGQTWRGEKLDLDDWKSLLVSAHAKATNRPGRILPGIEGEYVAIRHSTARMSKSELSSLIQYITAWMAGNGIPIRDGHQAEYAR